MQKDLCSVFDFMNEGFAYHKIVCDEAGLPCDYIFIEINTAFEKLTGLKRENLIGKRVTEVLPRMEQSWLECCIEVAVTGETIKLEQYQRDLKKWVRAIVFSMGRNEFCILFVDITDVRMTLHSYEKYKLLFENSRDVILFMDEKGKIIDANKGAVALYGYEPEEFMNLSVKEIRAKDSMANVKEQFEQAKRIGITFETNHVRKDGSVFPVEVSSKGIVTNGETIIMSIIRDISVRKLYENDLICDANNDYLTNLPNRRHVFNSLSRMCETVGRVGKKLAVIYFDIDKFKSINDTFGHDIGDEVLKEIARRISKVTRAVDVFGRIGGDEFVLLQPYVRDQRDVSKILDRIIQEFCTPIRLGEVEIQATTSIGISVFPDDSTDRDVLMSLADKAMYLAKKEAGNTLRYHGSL